MHLNNLYLFLLPARLWAQEVVVGPVLVDLAEAGPVVHDRYGRGARGPDWAITCKSW
jgi:hypothetical protein